MSKRSFFILATAGIMLSYYAFGYSDAVRGAVMPELLAEMEVDYAAGGLLSALHYLGYCTAVLGFGVFAARIPKRWYMILANAAALAGVLLYLRAQSAVLACGILIVGFALGMYEFCGNAMIRTIYPKEKRPQYVNIFSAMHSVGAISAPLLLSALLGLGWIWKSAFVVVIPLIAAGLFLFGILRWDAEVPTAGQGCRLRDYWSILRYPKLRAFFAMAFCYIAAESGVILWMVSFFCEKNGETAESAARWLSLFFVFIAIGRFAGGFLVDRLGYKRAIRWAFPAAGLCILSAVLLGGTFSVALPAAGIFMSLIFPTLAAAISMECGEKEDLVMGAFYSFSALGGLLSTYCVGQISAWFGMTTGFLVVVAMCAAGTWLARKI